MGRKNRTAWMVAVGLIGASAAGAEEASRQGVKAAARGAFYCNAGALSAAERTRHGENTLRLKRARVETVELDNGLRFRIAGEQLDLATLAEWVALERRCCPFFGFAIEVEPHGAATWLSLTGAAGVKEFIRAELG